MSENHDDIEYTSNKVTDEKVSALYHDLRSAPKERKLGRYFAWRHTASLQRDQERGYHWGYLIIGSPEGNKVQCTCGITIPQVEQKVDWSEPKITGILSPIQRTRAHRNLPDQKDEVVAIIFEFVYRTEANRHFASGYCQECGTTMIDEELSVVRVFINQHNEECRATL